MNKMVFLFYYTKQIEKKPFYYLFLLKSYRRQVEQFKCNAHFRCVLSHVYSVTTDHCLFYCCLHPLFPGTLIFRSAWIATAAAATFCYHYKGKAYLTIISVLLCSICTRNFPLKFRQFLSSFRSYFFFFDGHRLGHVLVKIKKIWRKLVGKVSLRGIVESTWRRRYREYYLCEHFMLVLAY